MKAKMVREIDELGRIVLPQDLRDSLSWAAKNQNCNYDTRQSVDFTGGRKFLLSLWKRKKFNADKG